MNRAGFTDIVVHESVNEITEVSFTVLTPVVADQHPLGWRGHTGLRCVNRIMDFIDEVRKIAPNLSRLLRRWGVLEDLRGRAIALEKNSVRSQCNIIDARSCELTPLIVGYEDDTEIGTTPFMPQAEELHGAPLWVVHRADLQEVLLAAARKFGIDIRTGHHVEVVDFGSDGTKDIYPIRKPRYIINKGDSFEADVIICADGIKSRIRTDMMKTQGQTDTGMYLVLCCGMSFPNSVGLVAQCTGDAAYRITIPREKLLNRPELLKLVDESVGYRWMGPGGHIMAYPIRNHQLLNMVLLHPDRCDTEESWTATGPKSNMIEFYSSWSPTVRALLDLVEEDEIPEWQLKILKPLVSWVEGCVTLMGDACHPTLPYVAQGAAQAVEDAGVLAAVLSLINDKADIHNALLIYSVCDTLPTNFNGAHSLLQQIRKTRAEIVVASASKTRETLHLPDGPDQIMRDAAISKASRGECSSPDLWGDKSFQAWIWGVDIQQEAVDKFERLFHQVRANPVVVRWPS